jgi:branched-subunit amino acid aminotransferase/4-amino-4-deoxychorismate lyase
MSEIIILQSGDAAALNPTQSGFAHGFGIFETIKLSQGQLLLWAEHWKRLVASASELALPLPHEADQVLAAIRELVEAEGLYDGIVKVSLMAAGGDSECYVYTRPLVQSPAKARLLFSAESRLNENSLLVGHKTHNYMENMLLLRVALAADCSDVIRVNSAGELAETAVGNLFFIQNDTLYTPSLATGVLPGVVRSLVLETAEILEIPVVEGAFFSDVLQLADAVFITNSLVGIQPVNTVVVNLHERNVDSAANLMLQDLQEALVAVEAAGAIDLG